jgi:hypothetical protein
MGGNLINYPGDCGTPIADLITVKLLLTSIISTPNAKFMSINIKDFYLCTSMEHYEYSRMKLGLFPEDIIADYEHATRWMPPETSTAKSDKACMDSHTQESLHRNYLE